MVDHLIDVLEEKGQLENTVIVYSADHGYHLGQHRVPCGKTLPYKEDTHVPFFIRGPGIPKGLATDLPSNHIDIAPTLLDLAGMFLSGLVFPPSCSNSCLETSAVCWSRQ